MERTAEKEKEKEKEGVRGRKRLKERGIYVCMYLSGYMYIETAR